jgi:hypothetical protein
MSIIHDIADTITSAGCGDDITAHDAAEAISNRFKMVQLPTTDLVSLVAILETLAVNPYAFTPTVVASLAEDAARAIITLSANAAAQNQTEPKGVMMASTPSADTGDQGEA